MMNEENVFDSEEKYFEECLSNDRPKRLKEKYSNGVKKEMFIILKNTLMIKKQI